MIRPQCGTRNGYQIHGKNGEEACPPCKLAQSAYYEANKPSAKSAGAPGPEPKPLAVPGKWVEDALCAQVDPDLWFPEKGGAVRQAKMICRDCPVQTPCLQYALDNDEQFGIWGATSVPGRRRLKRRAAA